MLHWHEQKGSLQLLLAELRKTKHPDARLDTKSLCLKYGKLLINQGLPNDAILLSLQGMWAVSRRPFYNVWPCIGEALARTSLDLTSEHLYQGAKYLIESQDISPVIYMRWAKGHELDGVVSSAFAAVRPVLPLGHSVPTDGLPCLVQLEFWIEAFLRTNEEESLYGVMHLHKGTTIKESLHQLNSSTTNISPTEFKIREQVFRVAVGVFLMASQIDSDLVTPVPDSELPSYKLSYKQKKQGKKPYKRKGWDIGRFVEFSPHIRRPHFGLRWTDKGRTVPKIVPIKGSVVRRNKMTDVPTGYLDKENKE